MRRAFKFRAYPTRPQEGRAARLLADHCDLYNAALEERREAWRMRQLDHLRDAVRPAAGIRHADPGSGPPLVHGPAADPPSAQCRIRRVLRAGSEGEGGLSAVQALQPVRSGGFVVGDGAKWTPAPAGGWARAAFQAVGSVKVRQHRPVPGTVKFLQLKREYRRWYVIVITDTEAEPHPATGRAVGVDVGVARFATTSDGEIVANPKFLAASAEVIADLQRRKDRARRGSGNRRRIRRHWRKSGGRSGTGAATSTTKPHAPS